MVLLVLIGRQLFFPTKVLPWTDANKDIPAMEIKKYKMGSR